MQFDPTPARRMPTFRPPGALYFGRAEPLYFGRARPLDFGTVVPEGMTEEEFLVMERERETTENFAQMMTFVLIAGAAWFLLQAR